MKAQQEKSGNVLQEKSFALAQEIVAFYYKYSSEYKNAILLRQLLRSGTSVGANIEEAAGASSKKDFANKFHIALKECRETLYWLRLLKDIDSFDHQTVVKIYHLAHEIVKILTASLKTLKNE